MFQFTDAYPRKETINYLKYVKNNLLITIKEQLRGNKRFLGLFCTACNSVLLMCSSVLLIF